MSESDNKENILDKLNDPEILRAAAAKFGLKLVANVREEKEEKKPRPRPVMEVTDEDDMDSIKKKMVKFMNEYATFVDEEVKDKVEQVEGNIKNRELEAEKAKIREFAKKHKHFNDLIPIMNPLYQSGSHTLEEAYMIAMKAKGLEDDSGSSQGKNKKKEEKVEKPPASPKKSSSIKSEDGSSEEDLTPTKKSTKDVIKGKLEDFIAEHGSDALGE